MPAAQISRCNGKRRSWQLSVAPRMVKCRTRRQGHINGEGGMAGSGLASTPASRVACTGVTARGVWPLPSLSASQLVVRSKPSSPDSRPLLPASFWPVRPASSSTWSIGLQGVRGQGCVKQQQAGRNQDSSGLSWSRQALHAATPSCSDCKPARAAGWRCAHQLVGGGALLRVLAHAVQHQVQHSLHGRGRRD